MDNIKERLNISDTAIVSDDVMFKYRNKDNLNIGDNVYIIADTITIKYLNYRYYLKLIDILNKNNIVPTIVIDTLNIDKHILDELCNLSYNIKYVDCSKIVNIENIPRNIDYAITKIKSVCSVDSKIIVCDYSTVLATQFIEHSNYYYIAGNNVKCTHMVVSSIDNIYDTYISKSYVLSKIYELGISNINIILLDNYEIGRVMKNSLFSTYNINDETYVFANNNNNVIIEADDIESTDNIRLVLSLIGCNIILVTKSNKTMYIDKTHKVMMSYCIDDITKLHKFTIENDSNNIFINMRTDGISGFDIDENKHKYVIDRELDGYKTLTLSDKINFIKEFMSIRIGTMGKQNNNLDIVSIKNIMR